MTSKQVKIIALSKEEMASIHPMTSKQLFAHLVAAGPTMHGAPGSKKPKHQG
jgi:hypothetical protein